MKSKDFNHMKKALLVMDLIQVYIYGGKPLIPIETREKMVRNIKKAIDLAHQKKIPAIFINSAFRKSDPIFYKYINYRNQAMEGVKSSQIVDELKPEPQDHILKKRGYDGFWKSGLEKLLKKLKIEEVYLAGLQTDCCIRETAVTAAHLGYNVYVLEDCCQTSREFGQIAALRFLRTCTKAIITVKDLLSHFRSGT